MLNGCLLKSLTDLLSRNPFSTEVAPSVLGAGNFTLLSAISPERTSLFIQDGHITTTVTIVILDTETISFRKTTSPYVRYVDSTHGLQNNKNKTSPIRIKIAMLKVPREDFVPWSHKNYAYLEVPFPLPHAQASISSLHSDPLFYEP